jgi:hypothetical protein
MRASPEVRSLVPQVEESVRNGTLPPSLAADRILSAFLGDGGAE